MPFSGNVGGVLATSLNIVITETLSLSDSVTVLNNAVFALESLGLSDTIAITKKDSSIQPVKIIQGDFWDYLF